MPPNVQDSGDAIMRGKVDETLTKEEDHVKKKKNVGH